MKQLTPEILDAIFAAAVSLQLDRNALLLGIPSAFTSSLKQFPDSASQILGDLHALDDAVQLGDGSYPLHSWLRNARRLSVLRAEQDLFIHALHTLEEASTQDRATAEEPEDPLLRWHRLVSDLATATVSERSEVEERIFVAGHEFAIQQAAFAFCGVPITMADPDTILPLARLARTHFDAQSLPDSFSRGFARVLADLSASEVQLLGRLLDWALAHCSGRRITLVALDREPADTDVSLWQEGPWRVLAFATPGKSLREPDGVIVDLGAPTRVLSLMKGNGLARDSSFPGWWDIEPFRVEFDRETLQRLTDIFQVRSPNVESAPPVPSTSRPPVGSALIGPVSASGGGIAGLNNTVASMAAGFRRCFSNGLKEDPTMRGTMRVIARIGPNGEVLSARAVGGEYLSGSVVSCVQARIASAQFAPPSGGGATIEIPIRFESQ